MAQQLGEIVRRQQSPSAASPQSCEKYLPVDLIPPTTEAEAARLADWAASAPRSEPAATPTQIARHLQFLDATLPSKATDEETAKMRFAVYAKLLTGQSNAALAFMSQRACRELDWFPTPKQCLAILKDYVAPATPRETALMLVSQFHSSRFDEWIEQFKAGTMTDIAMNAAPDRWKRIAVERGFLRYGDENEFIIRKGAA